MMTALATALRDLGQLDLVFSPPDDPAALVDLGRYVNEFAFRLNEGNVKTRTLARLDAMIAATRNKRITYKELIWSAFKHEANRIYSRGRRHYSARTILEWLRHESMVAEIEPQWKLNNNYAPDMARLWLLIYPERVGFFELRSQEGSAVRAA